LQSIEGRIEMAVGASELALKGKLRRVEQAFAAAARIDDRRPAESDSAEAVSRIEIVSSRRSAM